ncbi:hypothetical protein AO738_12720 [Pseudomonas citronellolis]|nr:hypothetical protein AO738_12720 [Pseudomonas citronellolis]
MVCGIDKATHWREIAVERIKPVLQATLPGDAQACGDLVMMHRVLLDHVNAPFEQGFGQLGPRAADHRRAYCYAGQVDLGRQCLDAVV